VFENLTSKIHVDIFRINVDMRDDHLGRFLRLIRDVEITGSWRAISDD